MQKLPQCYTEELYHLGPLHSAIGTNDATSSSESFYSIYQVIRTLYALDIFLPIHTMVLFTEFSQGKLGSGKRSTEESCAKGVVGSPPWAPLPESCLLVSSREMPEAECLFFCDLKESWLSLRLSQGNHRLLNPQTRSLEVYIRRGLLQKLLANLESNIVACWQTKDKLTFFLKKSPKQIGFWYT